LGFKSLSIVWRRSTFAIDLAKTFPNIRTLSISSPTRRYFTTRSPVTLQFHLLCQYFPRLVSLSIDQMMLTTIENCPTPSNLTSLDANVTITHQSVVNLLRALTNKMKKLIISLDSFMPIESRELYETLSRKFPLLEHWALAVFGALLDFKVEDCSQSRDP
jgi:hypothetical protein